MAHGNYKVKCEYGRKKEGQKFGRRNGRREKNRERNEIRFYLG